MTRHSDVTTLKRITRTLLFLLAVLILYNFYGPFSNRFYFGKLDGYLFLLLPVFQGLYLFKLANKVKKKEVSDAQFRYMEYVVYGILIIYGYKILDTLLDLQSATTLQSEILPKTFFPLVIFSLVVYGTAVALSLWTFKMRKRLLGSFGKESLEDKGIRRSL